MSQRMTQLADYIATTATVKDGKVEPAPGTLLSSAAGERPSTRRGWSTR